MLSAGTASKNSSRLSAASNRGATTLASLAHLGRQEAQGTEFSRDIASFISLYNYMYIIVSFCYHLMYKTNLKSTLGPTKCTFWQLITFWQHDMQSSSKHRQQRQVCIDLMKQRGSWVMRLSLATFKPLKRSWLDTKLRHPAGVIGWIFTVSRCDCGKLSMIHSYPIQFQHRKHPAKLNSQLLRGLHLKNRSQNLIPGLCRSPLISIITMMTISRLDSNHAQTT